VSGQALPPKFPVAGVLVSATTYTQATDLVVQAALAGESLVVSATSVHGVSVAHGDPRFGAVLNGFELVVPDGQPVRWGLNLLHGAGLADRVYGPTLMLRICEAAAAQGVPVFFYGSTQAVLERLAGRLRARLPGLRIAGYHSPPFRRLTDEEDATDRREIQESGARIVFVGLGCPRQELWADRARGSLPMPLVCVGAAFDFHAGLLRQAPPWIQRRGLEWAFRLSMEPRRLWRRYARAVPLFIFLLSRQYLAQRMGSGDLRRRRGRRPSDGGDAAGLLEL
jgi:exopolysaccharide biosynthesis WecB/TagA/CpsF family protein